MRYSWIRTAANTVIFGGWMLPALLARLVPERVAATSPAVVRSFDIVAGGWAALAVAYGLVVALRVRRGIVD